MIYRKISVDKARTLYANSSAKIFMKPSSEIRNPKFPKVRVTKNSQLYDNIHKTVFYLGTD